MDSAERLPSKIRRFAYQAIDDLILWKKLSGPQRVSGWRNGSAGVDLRLGRPDDFRTQPKLRSRFEDSFAIVATDPRTSLPVGYVWGTNAPRLHEGVEPFVYQVHPKPDSLYFYDLQVDRRFRQFGLGRVILQKMVEEAAARGNDSAFYTIDRRSAPMIAISAALGFQVVGCLTYRCRLGLMQVNLDDLEVVCAS